MIMPYKGKTPKIASNAFIAPNATIIGDVEIGDGASVWYGTVLRGDSAPIRIGTNTNIQDNCTIHTDIDKPADIGNHVTVGHNAVVHGCTVENHCLIGMNAVVLSGAYLKTGCIIAAGALIRENQSVGPFQLLAGMPAVVKKELTKEILKILEHPVAEYLELSRHHLAEIEKNDEEESCIPVGMRTSAG